MFEVAMLIIGLSVAVLVFFLIQTLKKVQTSLDAASKTLTEVQSVVHTVKGDVSEIVTSAKRIADQAESKLTAIDPLVESVRETGEVLNEVATVAHNFSSIWTDKLKQRAQTLAAKQEARKAAKEAAASLEPVPSLAIDAGHDSLRPAHSISVEGQAGNVKSSSLSWLDWMETGVKVARAITGSR
ncbi:uncharacterized protein YoxC [Paenibacillus phyllosphaerae]|uniref:Uncharacterized protein YoxC n=1 Tax=Paenibacillus phyllosphaerae TaxID=274593 RepID=A0A7W5B0V0_9BACL|nr:DUF948 domain-containing protein [Paenibacillus phyllosphaerae]MBB3112059.1 uncharacterized protein YoxC [Paenibacillus phyllosphaerae]